MQRILMILCTGIPMLFTHPTVHAQEQTASFKRNLIGGSVSFSSSTGESFIEPGKNRTNSTFSAGPLYAHYLKEHLALGVALSYSSRRDEQFNMTDKNVFRTYYFAPFVRFELPLWQSRFAIYNHLGISGSYMKSTYETPPYPKSHTDSWGAGAFWEPGLMFRLKSNVLLQASYGSLLAYNYQHTDYATSHSFSVLGNQSLSSGLTFGINFLF